MSEANVCEKVTPSSACSAKAAMSMPEQSVAKAMLPAMACARMTASRGMEGCSMGSKDCWSASCALGGFLARLLPASACATDGVHISCVATSASWDAWLSHVAIASMMRLLALARGALARPAA